MYKRINAWIHVFYSSGQKIWLKKGVVAITPWKEPAEVNKRARQGKEDNFEVAVLQNRDDRLFDIFVIVNVLVQNSKSWWVLLGILFTEDTGRACPFGFGI